MGTAAWNLLGKSWKGLLLVALNKEEVKSGEQSSRGSSRRMRNRGRRGRNLSTEDWIEEMGELVSSQAPPGYRLSAMLVQRARLGSKWNSAWDTELEKMRDTCSQGVHPVWLRLGNEAPLLAEMAIYPEMKIEQATFDDSSDWIDAARIDPTDRPSLAAWLDLPIPYPLSAENELNIQRISKSLKAKGKVPKLSDSLNDLDGDVSLVRALIRVGQGEQKGVEDLQELCASKGEISTVASDQIALFKLRSGDDSSWIKCHGANGDDELSTAMRYQAWMNAPENAELNADELREGIQQLGESEARNDLIWSLISALIKGEEFEEALQQISALNIADTKRLPITLNLIGKSGDGSLAQQVQKNIHKMDDGGVQLIIETEGLPLSLRSAAVVEVQDRGGLQSEDLAAMALDIFTESGDAMRIGAILMKMKGGASIHPHRTLLVHHLLPGNAEKELCNWVFNARQEALEVLANESSGALSETSIGLVKLLEGAPADLAVIQRRVAANREAIRAFNQCRQALLKGGDGLVPADRLDKLQVAIENSSLGGLELRLFCAVLDQLRFNRAIRLLEDHSEESTKLAIETLDKLVGNDPRKPIVEGIRQIVLEHDSIAIPAFAEWHRLNAASSSWHQIILASIEESRGNHLSAGRSLRRASLDLEFSFENRVRLSRRALISFAHAGKFSEAVEMLESQQALSSALTGLFQLYLHVCDDAQRQQPENARQRLLDWIAQTEVLTVEGEDGEIINKERTTYPSDELDLLFSYPNAHRLPAEPWQGRIRSAIRGIRENRRSPRSQLEARFRHALADNLTVQEVESVAGEAANLNPTQGLMMFERAMNSGQFSNNEMRALLRIQNGIFRLNEGNLPIRVRRKLRHLTLKPLVLVDTNLLIDAAKDRIGLLLNEEGGIETSAHGSFHRTVLYKAQSGAVELMIPTAAQKEFKEIMANVERVRWMFEDVWVNDVEWAEKVTTKSINSIYKEVLSEYTTWKSMDAKSSDEMISTFDESISQFLLKHRNTYFELVTTGKSIDKKRTEINGEDIYPEDGDRDIMRDAAILAESTHKGIGAILIASRDSDFWIVRRSLEENFGFGVVRSARELGQWI